MHRALIVSSKYDPATGYPDREAWRISNKRLGLRLQQHGYAVEWLEPGAGQVRKLRDALATEDPLSAVVMVFSGYVLLTESSEPALLLSDEQVIALRLEQLCSKASRTFGRVLLVIDAVRGSSTRIVHDANPQVNEASAEMLLARMAVRTVRGDNTGMLVRVAPWGSPDAVSDAGLCEQLSRILEDLDDAQALATPELELDLLDAHADAGSAVLCRHSKPAFVFLPARRFASEPPKAPRFSEPLVDDGVAPYTARSKDDDRRAWPPPSDHASPSDAAVAHDTASRPDVDHLARAADEQAAAEASAKLAPEVQATPLSLGATQAVLQPASTTPVSPLPDESAEGQSPVALGHAVLPAPPALPTFFASDRPLTSARSPATAPPLPAGAPPAPEVSIPTPEPPRASVLGTPPPLPFERASAAPLPPHVAAPSFTTSEARDNQLGTPPPLPFERAGSMTPAAEGTNVNPAQPLARSPLPSTSPNSLQPPSTSLPAPAEVTSRPLLPADALPALASPLPAPVSPHLVPPLPRPVSPPVPPAAPVSPLVVPPAAPVSPLVVPPQPALVSPLVVPPLPSAGAHAPLAQPLDIGVPPPLPYERASRPELANSTLEAEVLASEPDEQPTGDPAEVVGAAEASAASELSTSSSAPAASPGDHPAPPGDQAASSGDDAATALTELGSSSNLDSKLDADEAQPSQRPSHAGPPPRKHRDSGAPDTSVLAGAPSLPPPVLSPESWRPAAPNDDASRDEAALLQRAQEYLSTNQLELALSHAKECLDSFPESAQALQIAGSVLVSQGDFTALASLYEQLIARLAPTEAAQLCAAASRLWQKQLNDPQRGRELLEQGLRLDATNPSLQRELADVLDASGAHGEALAHSLSALRTNPFSPSVAQATYQRLLPDGSTELKFTVACLLSFLGHASNHVVDTIAAHRGASLRRPARSLNEDDFRFGLDAAQTDPELSRVFALLEPCARQLELPKPKQQRQLLESLRAEDVERSTTMLARTFGWTCRLLTLGSPALFLSEADSLPQLLPVEGSSFVVGKSLGRGLSVAELAFLWGRALAWSGPQTRILYTLPNTLKLSQLLRAARVAGGLQEPDGADTKGLGKALRKEIPASTWNALLPALEALGPDVESRVELWKHAADRVANRIGLLASGDPELAARTLDRFPTAHGGPRKVQVSELLSFALSEQYGELRQRLGLHLG